MQTSKVAAGSEFPPLVVKARDDADEDIGQVKGNADWKMVVVYRGAHCPMCTKYLNNLENYLGKLSDIGVEVAAVSADSKEQLEDHLESLDVTIPLYYGMSLEQMEALGLYISHPRSPKETDHLFPEPGLFVINKEHQVQVVDISNNPFVRPEPETLTAGVEFIKDPENEYPIRGTYTKS